MIILYPTETIYGLGVNAFDENALRELYRLKGREANKAVSVLVRDLADMERWGEVPPKAKLLAAKFLPGPLTLVLKARDEVPRQFLAPDGTLGFRISSDEVAQKVIADFMQKYDAPLTSTSANPSGEVTAAAVPEILDQFGDKAKTITKIYDDGPRRETGSTIVRIIDEKIEILRTGRIDARAIGSTLKET